MNLGAVDFLLALIFLTLCAVSAAQGLIRSIFSLLVAYLATVAAGLLYPYMAIFVSAIGGKTPTLTQFVVFWILFAGATVALEIALRKGFPDTRLPALGFLDHVLGLLPGILWGLIVISLLLFSMGYAPQQPWGKALSSLRAATAYLYESSGLRPLLAQFLSFYMTLHGLWMPVPPPILGHGL